jgi:acyl-CoA thioester hydrolase
MTFQIQTDIRVPFFDVDSMYMTWHGHYAKYFELARCDLLEYIGHDYEAMFASGYSWPVVDMRIRYMRPLRFNQLARVTTLLKRWDHQLRIAYRIRDAESGSLLARGYTLQVPVDMATGEMHPGQPEAVTRALQRAGLDAAGQCP